MARPHVEFVHAQMLPWQDYAVGSGVTMKLLSRDAETGASSAILRYPPGWSTAPEALDRDEEFLVLDGALEHDGTEYGPDSYAFWPGGYARQAVSAPRGATVLTFFSATVTGFDPARLTARISLRDGNWQADLAAMGLELMARHAWIRRLRSDPVSGEMTYVTAVMPYFQESQPERHPVIQEIFVLAGEVAGPQGIMRAGSYVWRPENKTHGPYGSTTGAVFLFRSHGGPQSTEHDPPAAFDFEPPHRPILPEALREAGALPLPAPTRY